MDLNYLYHRHQVSLFRSEHAACDRSRAVHGKLTDGYAEQIARLRQHAGYAAAA